MKKIGLFLAITLLILSTLLTACEPQEVVVTEVVEKEVEVVVTEVVEKEVVVTQVVEVAGEEKIIEVTRVVEVEVTTEPAEAGPKRGGVLKVGGPSNPGELDPALFGSQFDHNYMLMTYESLVGLDDEMRPIPRLAESWEVSDDELTYTFHLRDDVTWHNGDPFVAADVKYSMERLLDPETASTRIAGFAAVESVEIMDDYMVAIHLSEPLGAFLTQLQDNFLIVNQRFVEENDGDISNTMMGTGPFMFDEFISDQVIRLVKNPNYWRMGTDGQPLPYLDGIDWLINDDKTAQVVDLEAGVLDLLPAVPAEDSQRLRADSSLVATGPDTIWWTSIRFDTTLPPWDDVRVRQAISWAIDRDELAEVGRFNNALPAYGAGLPRFVWSGSKSPQIYTHQNLAKARVLLAEAGYTIAKDGTVQDFPDVTISVFIDNTVISLAEFVVGYLQELGINAKIEQYELATFVALCCGEEGNTFPDGTFIGGWVGIGDPETSYRLTFHSDGPFNSMFFWSNPEFDRLMDEAAVISDLDQRAALYAQADAILLEELPEVFLTYEGEWDVMHQYVKGYYHRINRDNLPMAETWLDR